MWKIIAEASLLAKEISTKLTEQGLVPLPRGILMNWTEQGLVLSTRETSMNWIELVLELFIKETLMSWTEMVSEHLTDIFNVKHQKQFSSHYE